MEPATTPPMGTHQGQAMPPAGTPAPQRHPSLLLWENPLFSGWRDKDEKGRGFLEGRAAGTVWGNTRQGLCCDKAPAGARGLEGLSDKGNWGQPAPAALNTPKPPFILSAASRPGGSQGTARGCVPQALQPAPASPGKCRMQPLCAGHPPHLIPCSLTGAGIDAVPNPGAGAAVPALARLCARRPAGVMPARSQRLHPPPCPGCWQLRGFPGCCQVGVVWWGSAVPCPRHSRGRRFRGRVAPAPCTLQPVPAAGEAEWGSHVFGCPEGTGSALAWPPALCFPTPPVPCQSWGRAGSCSRH